jgi:hypothetical protein
MRDVQNQNHTIYPLPPRPVFPDPSFISTFLRPSLIERLCKPHTAHLLSSPPPSTAPPLTIETYKDHWTALLAWELDNLTKEKEELVLWKMSIKVSSWGRDEFSLFVAGIRENFPRLEVGDLVHLRELREDLRCGSGIAFEGRVVMLRKREGLIRMSIHFHNHAVLNSMTRHCRSLLPDTQVAHSAAFRTACIK